MLPPPPPIQIPWSGNPAAFWAISRQAPTPRWWLPWQATPPGGVFLAAPAQ